MAHQRSHEPLGLRVLQAGVLAAVAVSYAAMRVHWNVEHAPAGWDILLRFEAPLPFGHRVLMPMLGRALEDIGLATAPVRLILECSAATGLAFAVQRFACTFYPLRTAGLLTMGVFVALAHPFALPHHWAVFYPWDTPAMLAMVLGALWSLHARAGRMLVLTAVAALNRESAVLLPAVFVCLAGHWRWRWHAGASMLLVFFAARTAIALALPELEGSALSTLVGDTPRWLLNLRWLTNPTHIGILLVSLAYMPAVVWLRWRAIDLPWRRIVGLAAVTSLGLLIVGNIDEPRIFGEVLMLSMLACMASKPLNAQL